MTLTDEKKQWRDRIRALRRTLSPAVRSFETESLTRHILKDPRWMRAETVLLYRHFGSEWDTAPLIRAAWAAGKTVALPVCLPVRQMEAAQFTAETPLARTAFGVEEIPEGARNWIDVRSVDFCLAPALACDPFGTRIGYGGGYYDRFLPRLREDCTRLCAILTCQLVPERLPREATDWHLDELLTPNGAFLTALLDIEN